MFAFFKVAAFAVAMLLSTAMTAMAQLPVALPESDGYILNEIPEAEPAKIVDDGCGKKCKCNCKCCRVACCPTVEEITEEKSCFNVKCEQICVPAVTFPWEPGGSGLTLFNCLRKFGKSSACCDTCGSEWEGSCGECCVPCPKKCGCVKCVAVLSEEKYEVTTCKCKWEIRGLPTCCPNCCDEVDCCDDVEYREEVECGDLMMAN